MAVASQSSALVTNEDATPRTSNHAAVHRGVLRASVATFELANGDSANSILRICTLPSNARVHRILLSCDALGGSCATDVGLYETTENGSAVVDRDAYASAVSLVSAVPGTDVAFEARDIARVAYRVWQDAVQTEDPSKNYHVAATLTAATAAAGTLTFRVEWVVD